MKITLRYERKNFFGSRDYTEDYIICRNSEAAQNAALKALKKVLDGTNSTMLITDYSGSDLTIWQEYSDIDSGTLTIRKYDALNSYTEIKMQKQMLRKILKHITQSNDY